MTSVFLRPPQDKLCFLQEAEMHKIIWVYVVASAGEQPNGPRFQKPQANAAVRVAQ